MNYLFFLLGRKGRLVLIDSRTQGSLPIDLNLIMRKNLVMTGSLLRPRPFEEKRAVALAIRRHLIPKIIADGIKPVISRRFPLAAAEEAHALVESRAHKGKVVLTI